MRRSLFTVPSLLLLASIAACGGSTRSAGGTATSEDTTGSAQRRPATAVATGETRAALLALKRVHFELDSDRLSDDARAALAEAAEKLGREPSVHVYVEGHTDERGTEEYNVSLGDRRARAVIDHLRRLGVDAARLHPASFGEEQPLTTGADPRSLGRNRRVDFRLMQGRVELVLEEGTVVDDRGRPISDG